MQKLSPVLFGLVMFVGACAGQQESWTPLTSTHATRGHAGTSRHGNEGVVSLVVTMTVKPESEQEFLDICRTYAAYVHTHYAGVLLYTLNKDPKLEHTYVWIERHVDEEAIRTKAATPEYKAAVSRVMPLLAKPPGGRRLFQVIPK
ncbi:MAG: antibiotic biosynthesis monooxygenase family protein [Burkholderiaceae bacterium]